VNISFGNLVVVSVAAFFTPLVLGFFPRLRVRRWSFAGLLQATSLSFTIVAVQVGTELHKIRPENGAALILAGLLSLLIYPPAALSILRRQAEPSAASS
jgi:Kef-type K+ transport system membrane component KefB